MVARKKPKEKSEVVDPEHTCEYCNKSFSKSTTLLNHICEKKRRWLNKDDKYSRMAFLVFRKFYEVSYRNKPRTFQDFVDSPHYTGFIRFGRYLHEIQALNPEAFVEFLVKAEVPMKNWETAFVYEQFVRELAKREPADSAFERNILIMKQWETDTNEPWYDFFRKVNTNIATQLIRAGRLSPWVLYNATTSHELLARMTEEQLKLIEQYVTPVFWERKFSEHADDVEFISGLLKDAGV